MTKNSLDAQESWERKPPVGPSFPTFTPENVRKILKVAFLTNLGMYIHPRHPVIFSADDWGVQAPSQHSIAVPIIFKGSISHCYVSLPDRAISNQTMHSQKKQDRTHTVTMKTIFLFPQPSRNSNDWFSANLMLT